MTYRVAMPVGIVLALAAALVAPVFGQSDIKPPVAKKVARTTELHGDRLVDEYGWLREKFSPEVLDYLDAENAYSRAMMRPYGAFQSALHLEMGDRIKQTDLTAPVFDGQYYYYARTDKDKDYFTHCRKKGSLEAQEEVCLDLNEEGKGLAFIALGEFQASEDGELIAYTLDTTGSERYKLLIKNVAAGKKIAEVADFVDSIAWANDNRTLFYSTEDHDTRRPTKIFRYSLENRRSQLVYEEKEEGFSLSCAKTRSKSYILLISSNPITSEVRYLDANKPDAPPGILFPRKEGRTCRLDHRGDEFLMLTNDKGHNFRLITAPTSNPDEKNWKEIIPHRESVELESVSCFSDFYVVTERKDGLQKIRVVDGATGEGHYIYFPESFYNVELGNNADYNARSIRMVYESLVSPRTVLSWDVKKRSSETLKEEEVLGGYDKSQYQSERIHATAKDGVPIPITLLYRKEVKRDGKAPMVLSGYGAYGIPYPVNFSSLRLSLLNRGVILGVAHVRGGGEMGTIWHGQGRLMQKKNTFTDFITCAEHLIGAQYTAPDRLVIQGDSAGGLLTGAVVNMRPELFKAVVMDAPFVDVMNTMLDASLPMTVGEYLEWGNPNEKDAYFYIKSYSPYDNIGAKAYPSMLVTGSLNDGRVMYWESAKYVAKLRAMKTDKNPLLLRINMVGGHGGSSRSADQLREAAFEYCFILTQVGITK